MITVTEFKDYINEKSSSFDDALAKLVAGVNKYVASYCGNVLDEENVTEYLDGDQITEDNELFLKNRVNLSNVVLYYNSGTAANPTWVAESTADYVVYAAEGFIYLEGPRYGRKTYKVTYKAGYASGSVPDDLKIACYRVASGIWNKRRSEGESAEGMDGVTVSFTKEMTEDIEALLKPYLSVTV